MPQSVQGYHFPPPEPDPNYGYNSQPLLAQQPWPQQQPQQGGGYELSYQAYSGGDQAYAPNDPSPFQHAAHQHQQQQQGYGEGDIDYGDDFYEDEEPRRGRRWLLIAAALVGAIGVGGALAYTYRSLVAPHSRVPLVKVDPKVKVENRNRDLASTERTSPTPPPQAEPEPREEPTSDNLGPRPVKTIQINPGQSAAAEPPPAAPSPIPGITLYRQPAQAAAVPAAAPPAQAFPPQQPPARVAAPQQPGRVVIGTKPAPPSESDDDPPVAAPPVRRPAVQAVASLPKPPAPPRPKETASSGLGYVAVLSSKKTSMDALKEYADLQQRYPDVLGNKTPDVQEADLSARGLGTMYRLVVGPPGSHNAASVVCSQLKTAGYVGCWVKEY